MSPPVEAFGKCLSRYKDGDTLIVLFGGGTKRRQQADIDRAVVLHTEYKSRKAPKAAANKAEKRKR
jgi:predicted nucleotidyltransferase